MTSPSGFITTGTGLDQIVTALMADPGLNTAINPKRQAIKVQHTQQGAEAASGLNKIIADTIAKTGVAADGNFSTDDVVKLNGAIRADAQLLAQFTALHGDDENGVETGFHLVKADGGVTMFRGLNFTNKVVDGIYHLGFEIKDGHFLNEDGDSNASLVDVANWLNALYLGSSVVNGTKGNDFLKSGASSAQFAQFDNETFMAGDGNDTVLAGAGNDIVHGGAGNDRLSGDTGNDSLFGENGNDALLGGVGADRLEGGQGRDLLDAGVDADYDTLAFRLGDSGVKPGQIDVVMNFKSGQDKVDLSAIHGLSFAGDHLTGHGAEVAYRGGMMLVDANGDGKTDMSVQFLGGVTLTAQDFILN